MPKVFLTEQQREADRYKRLRAAIAEQIAVIRHREKLTAAQMSKRIGINHVTYAKLMAGEDVKLPTTTWLRLMDIARISLTVVRDEIEVDAQKRKDAL